MSILRVMLFITVFTLSCGHTPDSKQNGTKKNPESIVVEKELAIINEVKISYDETSLEGDNSSDLEESLENKGNTSFNGCSTQSLNKLIINGSAKNITIIIKGKNGKVYFEKKNIDLNGNITFTEKDINEITNVFNCSIFIKQNTTTLFSSTTQTSDCM